MDERQLRSRSRETVQVHDEALPDDRPVTKIDAESRDIVRTLTQLIYAGFLFTLLVGGLLYSAIYFDYEDNIIRARTPADTTHLHSKLPSFFADKRNFLNQIFVKKAWGWTTFAFVLLLASRPQQSVSHYVKPVIRYIFATAYWLLFTAWFFGPSVADRLLLLSGAKCVPSNFLTDQSLAPNSIEASLLSPELCLSGSRQWKEFQKTNAENVITGQRLDSMLASRPFFHGGHDVSGHTFLLVHASLFLIVELAPLIPLLFGTKKDKRLMQDWQRIASYIAMAIMALWAGMLLITSIYFHSPQEKISGFVVGVAESLVMQYLIGT